MFLAGEPVSNHDELMSNFFAQPDALAYGKTVADLEAEGVPRELQPHKEFPGNRPSLSLLFPALNAYSCGQLLAMYEHRVAVQGFIWGVNSFDQWGVELGKALASRVRVQLAGIEFHSYMFYIFNIFSFFQQLEVQVQKLQGSILQRLLC
jgi:glucose-6-phosphate isomerase